MSATTALDINSTASHSGRRHCPDHDSCLCGHDGGRRCCLAPLGCLNGQEQTLLLGPVIHGPLARAPLLRGLLVPPPLSFCPSTANLPSPLVYDLYLCQPPEQRAQQMTLSRGMFCRFIGNDFAFLYQRENKMDKEKNQVITSAEKEDGTDSTATETTAAFTSVCETEWDGYILSRWSSRNNNIERSDLCL